MKQSFDAPSTAEPCVCEVCGERFLVSRSEGEIQCPACENSDQTAFHFDTPIEEPDEQAS